LNCDLYKYMLYLSHGKAKEKKKKKGRGLPRVPGHLALGEEEIKKKATGLPGVPRHLTLGEGKIKKKTEPRQLALGEELKKTNFFPECCTRGRGSKKIPSTALNLPRVLPWHSGKSSPSVRILALGGELFPVSRFPGSSSCTRGRLPRVFLALPRVLVALGEAGGCCSDTVNPLLPPSLSLSQPKNNHDSTSLSKSLSQPKNNHDSTLVKVQTPLSYS
jgi:hypothetical protein